MIDDMDDMTMTVMVSRKGAKCMVDITQLIKTGKFKVEYFADSYSVGIPCVLVISDND